MERLLLVAVRSSSLPVASLSLSHLLFEEAEVGHEGGLVAVGEVDVVKLPLVLLFTARAPVLSSLLLLSPTCSATSLSASLLLLSRPRQPLLPRPLLLHQLRLLLPLLYRLLLPQSIVALDGRHVRSKIMLSSSRIASSSSPVNGSVKRASRRKRS
jgi:hypothetical protein